MTSTLERQSRALHPRTLASLPAPVQIPGFDRRSLIPSVIHIGVGGFHRAHQAVYLDDLARLGHTGWGEIGVGLRSPAMRNALVPQDGLYTLVGRGNDGDTARVIGSMTHYLFGPDRPAAVIDALASPTTRLVTLTITGDGYELDEFGEFRTSSDTVRADLARPHAPSTVFGYLVEALDRRRRAGLPGFTVLSCDNVPDNGRAARAAVLGFAAARDPELAAWIDASVAFPASMVDRITPGTDDRVRRLVMEQFGVRDRSPVAAEQFTQWVVEDDFSNGRPPLDQVGVQLVGDVSPYALIKKRLLNGGHCALGYLGVLAGHRTTSDAMADPVIAEYVGTLMRREIAPLLPTVPGMDLADYQRVLLERLSNARVSDELARLCGRGSTKMPAYLLPSLVEATSQGRPSSLLILAVAGWVRYLRGYGSNGRPIEIKDAQAGRLQRLARDAADDVRPLLAERAIFGDLGQQEDVVAALGVALRELDSRGPLVTMRRYLAEAARGEAVELAAGPRSSRRAVTGSRLLAPEEPLEAVVMSA